jgi:hypothetical protein
MLSFREIHVCLQLRGKGLFETKCASLHLEKPKLQEVFLSKTNSNRHIWNKMNTSPLENPNRQAVFLSKTNSIVTGKQSDRCSCF